MDRSFQKQTQLSAMEMANNKQQQLEQASSVHSLNNILKKVKGLNLEGPLAGLIGTEDTLKKFLQSYPHNNILGNATNGAMQQLSKIIIENDAFFKDTESALSLTKAFETALSSYKASTQIISLEGFANESQISELGNIVSHTTEALNQFSNLESFKAISRLENFPFQSLKPNKSNKSNSLSELDDNIIEDIEKLDTEISEELILVGDFNQLSDESQVFLISLYQNHYYPIVLNLLIIISWWKTCLEDKIDLSNMTFVFVDNVKGSMLFIDNYWNQNKAEIIRGLITNALYNTLFWFLFTK